jgi:hypothetical protein
MALATIGSLPPFDPKNQEWEDYCEIMEHFFAANEIADAAMQKSIPTSVVGAQMYSLMRNLLRMHSNWPRPCSPQIEMHWICRQGTQLCAIQ